MKAARAATPMKIDPWTVEAEPVMGGLIGPDGTVTDPVPDGEAAPSGVVAGPAGVVTGVSLTVTVE